MNGLIYDAPALVTTYVALLFLIPSNVTISGLASVGRPSMLWGLALLALWAVVRLQWQGTRVEPVRSPVRVLFGAFAVLALVSFAAAMLRGQPVDQISLAFTSLVRLASWAGVLLVIIDGVWTMEGLTLILRRVVVCVVLIAILGLAQVATGRYLLDFWSSVPGLTLEAGGLAERYGQVRASGPATHPLEFMTTINAALPLCLAAAMTNGFRWDALQARRMVWWVGPVLVALNAVVSLSRSAIIGLGVGAAALIPALPRRFRAEVIALGALLGALVVAMRPGTVGTLLGLFTSAASGDPSIASRTGGLDQLPEFVSASPVFGVGMGTFQPRYYIFDNQWASMAVELGVLGLGLCLAVLFAAIWSASSARHLSASEDVRLVGYALAAAVINITLLFTFFDGFAFPISAGFLFVLVGLCVAVRSVATGEALRRGQVAEPASSSALPPTQVLPVVAAPRNGPDRGSTGDDASRQVPRRTGPGATTASSPAERPTARHARGAGLRGRSRQR